MHPSTRYHSVNVNASLNGSVYIKKQDKMTKKAFGFSTSGTSLLLVQTSHDLLHHQ